MEGFVKTNIAEGLATITFFHPQSNSLPTALLQALAQAIEQAGSSPEVRLVLLQSEGEKAFCGGASFDELAAIDDEATGLRFFSGFAGVINAIRKCPCFVVVRVQGKAVGGGVGIASAADYCMATEDAAIKLSELAVGIGPFVIGPAVERKMGLAAFAQLSISATSWQTARWAYERGLFQQVLPTIAALDGALGELIGQLKGFSPEAVRSLKAVLWEGTDHWDELLQERAAISGRLVLSDFTKEAIARFKQK